MGLTLYVHRLVCLNRSKFELWLCYHFKERMNNKWILVWRTFDVKESKQLKISFLFHIHRHPGIDELLIKTKWLRSFKLRFFLFLLLLMVCLYQYITPQQVIKYRLSLEIFSLLLWSECKNMLLFVVQGCEFLLLLR